MRPRSLLVLTHELPPLGGGAGRAMARLCEALAARGLDIEIWTQSPGVAARPAFPFRVRYFATGRKAQFQTHVPSILLYAARIFLAGVALLAPGRRRPDLIFSNTALPTGCVGALLASILRVPHAIWYHGADVHQNRREGAGPFYRAALRLAWLRTDLHCFVSRGLLSLAEGYGGLRAPARVLPLFGDHLALSGTKTPAVPAAATASASSPAGRMFLFTGRLEAVKRPFLFLDAVESLIAGGALPADVAFRMVGGGDLFDPLRRRIEGGSLASRVSLDPPIPGASMGALYAAAHALVLTSAVEGYPLTILEAARCGVPSLGADTLGINEEIEDGKTGLLFASGDAAACAKAILRLLTEEGLRDRLGANARAAAAAMTSGKSADLFLEMLEREIPG